MNGIRPRYMNQKERTIVRFNDPKEGYWYLRRMVTLASEERGYSPSSLMLLINSPGIDMFRSTDLYMEWRRKDTMYGAQVVLMNDRENEGPLMGLVVGIGAAHFQDIPYEGSDVRPIRNEYIPYWEDEEPKSKKKAKIF